ncbi:MAG TPA: molybdopterin-binding protein [Nocardioidaceae bacterium]|nr:molybdopterin-binding protein [Nocardioidaceae bacterium]
MRVAICSVGAELVSGEIADTNASWLARRVLETGCRMIAILAVGDDRREIVQALEWLAERADVIVVGGGLGPTSDDLTRYAIADFAGVALARRSELVDHLTEVYAKLGRPVPPEALAQADVPEGGQVHQPLGSAAGFVVDTERSGRPVRVHAVPGVPWEYQGIADRDVLPDLVRRSDGVARVTRTLHVAGAGESWIGNTLRALTDRLDGSDDVEVGYLARSDEVQVRITAIGPTPTAARERATAELEEASALLGDVVTSVDGRRLEELVADRLQATGHTLALVETVTAGRISAALSVAPGAFGRLRGGLVSHDRDGAARELGVDGQEESVEGLAVAVRHRFGADIGVAVTGTAPGDGPSDGEPGTLAWAIAGPGEGQHREKAHIVGDREIVQVRGTAFVLEALRRWLGPIAEEADHAHDR